MPIARPLTPFAHTSRAIVAALQIPTYVRAPPTNQAGLDKLEAEVVKKLEKRHALGPSLRANSRPRYPLYALSDRVKLLDTADVEYRLLTMHAHSFTLPDGPLPALKHLCLISACMSGSSRNGEYLEAAANLLRDCPFDLIIWVDLYNVLALADAAAQRHERAGTTFIVVRSTYDLPLTRDLGGWNWARRQPRLNKFWAMWSERHSPRDVIDYSPVSPAAFATWIAKPSVSLAVVCFGLKCPDAGPRRRMLRC